MKGECVTSGYEFRPSHMKADPNMEAITDDGWLCTGWVWYMQTSYACSTSTTTMLDASVCLLPARPPHPHRRQLPLGGRAVVAEIDNLDLARRRLRDGEVGRRVDGHSAAARQASVDGGGLALAAVDASHLRADLGD